MRMRMKLIEIRSIVKVWLVSVKNRYNLGTRALVVFSVLVAALVGVVNYQTSPDVRERKTLSKAGEMFALHDLDKAKDKYLDAIEINKESMPGFIGAIECMYVSGDDEIKDLYQKAVEVIDKSDAASLLEYKKDIEKIALMAPTIYKNDDLAAIDAITKMNKVIGKSEAVSEVVKECYVNLADLYASEGDFAKTVDAYESALVEVPGDLKVTGYLSSFLESYVHERIESDDYETAKRLITQYKERKLLDSAALIQKLEKYESVYDIKKELLAKVSREMGSYFAKWESGTLEVHSDDADEPNSDEKGDSADGSNSDEIGDGIDESNHDERGDSADSADEGNLADGNVIVDEIDVVFSKLLQDNGYSNCAQAVSMNDVFGFDWSEMMQLDGSILAGQLADSMVNDCYVSSLDGKSGKINGLGVGLYTYNDTYEDADGNLHRPYYFYCGNYKDGKREGLGIAFMRTGENSYKIYRGNYSNDEVSGTGAVYVKSNSYTKIILGEWKHGLANNDMVEIAVHDEYKDTFFAGSFAATNGIPQEIEKVTDKYDVSYEENTNMLYDVLPSSESGYELFMTSYWTEGSKLGAVGY